MTHQLGKWLILAGLLMLLGALWQKNVLPEPQSLAAPLLDEPVQRAVSRAA